MTIVDTRIGLILYHQQQLEPIGAIRHRIDTIITTLDHITDIGTQHLVRIVKCYQGVIIPGIAVKEHRYNNSMKKVLLAIVAIVGIMLISMIEWSNKKTQSATVDDSKNSSNTSHDSKRDITYRTRIISSRRSNSTLSIDNSVTNHLNSKELDKVDQILSQIQRDSQEQLDLYTRNYGLTKEQQREIFPIIVAYHDKIHPSIKVNGQPIAFLDSEYALEQNIVSFLDSSQQEAFLEDAAASEAWWVDVVGQLEDDLDAAIISGEMVPADDTAADDGESISQPSFNLFDLLNK